jgi:hypothetical protein
MAVAKQTANVLIYIPIFTLVKSKIRRNIETTNLILSALNLPSQLWKTSEASPPKANCQTLV